MLDVSANRAKEYDISYDFYFMCFVSFIQIVFVLKFFISSFCSPKLFCIIIVFQWFLTLYQNNVFRMLSIFADQQSSKGNELNVTFLLGGTPSDGTKVLTCTCIKNQNLPCIKIVK